MNGPPSSEESMTNNDSDDLLPIIDPRQNLRALTDAASILKDCGLDNICIPNLKVAYNVSLIGKSSKSNPVWFNMSTDKYLIGSEDKLELSMNITNEGEDAYEGTFTYDVRCFGCIFDLCTYLRSDTMKPKYL